MNGGSDIIDMTLESDAEPEMVDLTLASGDESSDWSVDPDAVYDGSTDSEFYSRDGDEDSSSEEEIISNHLFDPSQVRQVPPPREEEEKISDEEEELERRECKHDKHTKDPTCNGTEDAITYNKINCGACFAKQCYDIDSLVQNAFGEGRMIPNLDPFTRQPAGVQNMQYSVGEARARIQNIKESCVTEESKRMTMERMIRRIKDTYDSKMTDDQAIDILETHYSDNSSNPSRRNLPPELLQNDEKSRYVDNNRTLRRELFIRYRNWRIKWRAKSPLVDKLFRNFDVYTPLSQRHITDYIREATHIFFRQSNRDERDWFHMAVHNLTTLRNIHPSYGMDEFKFPYNNVHRGIYWTTGWNHSPDTVPRLLTTLHNSITNVFRSHELQRYPQIPQEIFNDLQSPYTDNNRDQILYLYNGYMHWRTEWRAKIPLIDKLYNDFDIGRRALTNEEIAEYTRETTQLLMQSDRAVQQNYHRAVYELSKLRERHPSYDTQSIQVQDEMDSVLTLPDLLTGLHNSIIQGIYTRNPGVLKMYR